LKFEIENGYFLHKFQRAPEDPADHGEQFGVVVFAMKMKRQAHSAYPAALLFEGKSDWDVYMVPCADQSNAE
jgi:hypothetical protein